MELGEPEIIFVRSDQASPPTQAHLDTGEVSRTLEWFREVLLVVAKDGIITVKELKNVVKGNKVRFIPRSIIMFYMQCLPCTAKLDKCSCSA